MEECSFELFVCMAKPRYIALWHREGLEEADLEAMSPEYGRGTARMARQKLALFAIFCIVQSCNR